MDHVVDDSYGDRKLAFHLLDLLGVGARFVRGWSVWNFGLRCDAESPGDRFTDRVREPKNAS
jgi:hypothetical protein